jgi:hypothetical protein
MAAKTYLQLVNKVLTAINEPVLTEDNFSSAVAIHARARDAVNEAVRKIVTSYSKWPFMYKDYEEILTVGEQKYSLPNDCLILEAETFRIVEDDSLEDPVPELELKLISHARWAKNYRSSDYDDDNDGAVPSYVFIYPDGDWGVSTTPDQAYTVAYGYWKKFTDMEDHDDLCPIPEEWDHLVILWAIHIMTLYRTDFEVASEYKRNYRDAYQEMVHVLVPVPPDLVSTQVER